MKWRLGCTSFIIPDDILPNVRFLSGKVSDMELLFFEIAPDASDLPSVETVEELRLLAEQSKHTYTVHLPLKLQMSVPYFENVTLKNTLQLMRLVKPLRPWAYVLHLLDDQPKKQGDEKLLWQRNTLENLKILAEVAGGPELLAIENLEHYPPDFVEMMVGKSGVSRCFDVGHLWLDGHDPIPHLLRAMEKIRVIHIHGISSGIKGRDHKSLSHVLPDMLDAVLLELNKSRYAGVLTVEVFNERDLNSSQQTLAERMRILCLD